jgi:hypothetical protein
LALAVGVAVALAGEAQAQRRQQPSGRSGSARVEYELRGARQAWFADYSSAALEAVALQNLGCQVQLGQADGRYVVVYSMRGRETRRFALYEHAVQSADWLRQRGFIAYVLPD